MNLLKHAFAVTNKLTPESTLQRFFQTDQMKKTTEKKCSSF